MPTFAPGIVYLAAPYSHPDLAVRRARFEAATAAAARLVAQGRVVFSPLTMTHPIDLALAQGGESLGSAYWVAYDEAFMEHCTEMLILPLDGWESSSGIRRERAFFESRNRPVRFLDLDEPAKPLAA